MNQGKYLENATQCGKRMRKRDVVTHLYFILHALILSDVIYNVWLMLVIYKDPIFKVFWLKV